MLIGVVGKPSVGKSTFYKAMTLAEVDIANYPFTTIKPNRGAGHVEVECVDKEFNKQCNPREGYCIKHKRFIPVELLDVAGLVPGAHSGQGRGNQFLDDLNQANALIHVIDVSGSTNEKGEQVNVGDYDPAKDIRFLEEELDHWFFRILNDKWDRFKRTMQAEKGKIYVGIAKQMSGVGVTEKIVKLATKGMDEDFLKWSSDDLFKLCGNMRKLSKPMIIACNKADEKNGLSNFEKLKEEFPDYMMVPCSAISELTLKLAAKSGVIDYVPGESSFTIIKDINEAQKKGLDFIQTNVLDRFGSTGVQEVINKVVFDLLKYIAIFPGGVNNLADKDGNVLPDCFLMKSGSTALDFAYRLHTDIGKGFIKAVDVKTRRTIGKDHELKNRDVIEIMSSK